MYDKRHTSNILTLLFVIEVRSELFGDLFLKSFGEIFQTTKGNVFDLKGTEPE